MTDVDFILEITKMYYINQILLFLFFYIYFFLARI